MYMYIQAHPWKAKEKRPQNLSWNPGRIGLAEARWDWTGSMGNMDADARRACVHME